MPRLSHQPACLQCSKRTLLTRVVHAHQHTFAARVKVRAGIIGREGGGAAVIGPLGDLEDVRLAEVSLGGVGQG